MPLAPRYGVPIHGVLWVCRSVTEKRQLASRGHALSAYGLMSGAAMPEPDGRLNTRSADTNDRLELLVVMPVFNEEACVRKVVREWYDELQNWTDRFAILAISDGSTDGTVEILKSLQSSLGPRIEVVHRENCGHGQTCMFGYRDAVARGAAFVLQLDSDGQCDPQYFFRFWRERQRYDVIYGSRYRRDDGMRRYIASGVLRAVLFGFFRANCADANVPYRLMNVRQCSPAFASVPGDMFLANVGLAVLLRKTRGIRHGAVPIRFRERYGGEPKVPLSKFAGKAFELVRQCRAMLKRKTRA